MRPRLLDLYCGAGGCAAGYRQAGFEVTGVDHVPQPRYAGDVFILGDALEVLADMGRSFDAIHASPPCQKFSTATFSRPEANTHPDLVTPTVAALQRLGKPWVVENVGRSPLSPYSCVLCGLMFGLTLFRHRKFEASFLLLGPSHPSHRGKKVGVNGFVCVAGHGDVSRRCRQLVPLDHRNKASWAKAMQIDWMTRDELGQAIPPAYTQFVGAQLLAFLERRRAG